MFAAIRQAFTGRRPVPKNATLTQKVEALGAIPENSGARRRYWGRVLRLATPEAGWPKDKTKALQWAMGRVATVRPRHSSAIPDFWLRQDVMIGIRPGVTARDGVERVALVAATTFATTDVTVEVEQLISPDRGRHGGLVVDKRVLSVIGVAPSVLPKTPAEFTARGRRI